MKRLFNHLGVVWLSGDQVLRTKGSNKKNRVVAIKGKEPFLIIATHGSDDVNTDIIAATMARNLNGYLVVNQGWRRSKKANIDRSIADCNNVWHCRKDIVCGEFLDPIEQFKDEIVSKHGVCYTYLIHGMSKAVQKHAKDDVHVVLGYGQGDPSSYSCDLVHKDKFAHVLGLAGFNVYQGKSGGRFSAWKKSNVNQLWRKWNDDQRVHSIQVELVAGIRKTEECAAELGVTLGRVANRVMYGNDQVPKSMEIKEY